MKQKENKDAHRTLQFLGDDKCNNMNYLRHNVSFFAVLFANCQKSSIFADDYKKCQTLKNKSYEEI
jgi:hypothetical protein